MDGMGEDVSEISRASIYGGKFVSWLLKVSRPILVLPYLSVMLMQETQPSFSPMLELYSSHRI